MKKGGQIFGWIAFGFVATFALVALINGAVVATLFFAAAGVLVMPIEPLRRLRQKIKLKRILTIVLAVVCMVVGCVALGLSAPDSGEDVSTVGGVVAPTDETSEDSTTSVSSGTTTVTTGQTSRSTSTTTETTSRTTTTSATTPATTTSRATAGVTTTQKPTTVLRITTTTEQVEYSPIVYRTPHGERYHLDPDCGGKNSYQVSLQQALNAGLTPCKKCAQ